MNGTKDTAQTPDHGSMAPIYLLPIGDPDSVAATLYAAPVGKSFVYFIGHLALARDSEASPFGSEMAALADQVADLALRYSREGWIELTQRRVAEGCFMYIARRRKARSVH